MTKLKCHTRRHLYYGPSTVYQAVWLVLILHLVCSAIAAEPAPWPKLARKVAFKDATTTEKAILSLFDNGDSGIEGIAWIDLNRDGTSEIIVKHDSGTSYGPDNTILCKVNGKYVDIGWFRGFNVKLLARYNGYYQIEAWPKGYRGLVMRELTRFERGKYRCHRLDEFNEWDKDMKTITPPEFVKSWSPCNTRN